MLHSFTQNEVLPIDSDRPNQITSHINVSGLRGKVVRASVVIDITHSDPRDLRVGCGRDLWYQVLQERGRAPFQARRFELNSESIRELLKKSEPNGEWRLKIQDVRRRDGGQLNWWRLELEVVESGFNIEVRFQGGLTASQQSVFQTAAERWSEVIVGDLPEASIGGDQIDDVLIWAEGRVIDGPGQILGQAGPTHLRESSMLPIAGSMSFDSDDLSVMERNNILLPVILHEMGHVLGFGTIWRLKGLIAGSGTNDPRFTGMHAVEEWKKLTDLHNGDVGGGVPLANTGGPGTREAHWRESVFNDELMTGYVDAGINPMSRVTVASLKDLGYIVDLESADSLLLNQFILGVALAHRRCSPGRFNPIIVEGT